VFEGRSKGGKTHRATNLLKEAGGGGARKEQLGGARGTRELETMKNTGQANGRPRLGIQQKISSSAEKGGREGFTRRKGVEPSLVVWKKEGRKDSKRGKE